MYVFMYNCIYIKSPPNRAPIAGKGHAICVYIYLYIYILRKDVYFLKCMYSCVFVYTSMHHIITQRLKHLSRLLKIIGLFCKRGL